MKKIYENLIGKVEKNRNLIINTAEYVWNNPEIGYKEWKTSKYLEERFSELGYKVYKANDIPGFIVELDTGRPGPKIAVMGELDAVMSATHPNADKNTHAVHACGHFIQVSAMLGAAAVLKEEDILGNLCGSIRFMAVPAEETIDLEFRNELIRKGSIKYVAGKIEFLYRGMFDGVDMALMFHADTEPEKLFKLIDGCDGCITKHMEYQGVAAHAGGAPYKGINALYAASLGLAACNALRETFEEHDYIRYHPIITSGGYAANVIPDNVKMDTYVRAATIGKMLETNRKINRALAASAAALGANVLINDQPGNLPFHSDRIMNRLCEDVITDIFGEGKICFASWDTQSSDIGDISSLIPTIQPLSSGAIGNQHGEDYFIADKEKGIINPTKVIVCMIYELLHDGAALGRKVTESYQPLFKNKQEYFNTINAIEMQKKLVIYQEDGTVKLDIGNPKLSQNEDSL